MERLNSMEAILVACKECNIFSLSTDFGKRKVIKRRSSQSPKDT